MNRINTILATCLIASSITSCKDNDVEPIIITPPSSGTTLTLNGLIGAEAGSSAGNSVYIDLSADKQTAIDRSSWDLGFSSSAEFRVILNNSASAAVKVTDKINLTDIGEQDTIGLTLAIIQTNLSPTDFNYFDGLDGALSNTVIPAISATESDNKVIILNRGTGGGIAARPWVKLKVTRSTNGDYVLQYGNITQTSGFKTVTIAKEAKYNFNFLSLTSGAKVQVEPEKADWDIVWGYSVYKTNMGTAKVAYNISDLVFTNTHNDTEIAEVIKTNTNPLTYDNFTAAHLNNENVVFSKNRDVIGLNWRETTGERIGVKTDRFYLVKDNKGNIYKLKFNSFISNDGGTRGKPVIQYELLK